MLAFVLGMLLGGVVATVGLCLFIVNEEGNDDVED